MLKRVRRLALGVFLSVAGLGAGSAAVALDMSQARPHLMFSLGSYHLNASQDFNEFNPGIGLGVTIPDDTFGGELGLEFGHYENSLSSSSYYATGSYDWQVMDFGGNTTLRLGGFAGASHYPGDSDKFKGRGVPTIGNWVIVAGAQGTVRIDDTYDVRLRVMPAGNVADALFTLQLGVRF